MPAESETDVAARENSRSAAGMAVWISANVLTYEGVMLARESGMRG